MIARAAAALLAATFAAPSLAAGAAARGAAAFRACLACHALEPDRNLTGPSLGGLWGRKAGTLASYRRYSDALKRSGALWNESTLDAWLRSPQTMAPGNTMQFAGIADERARADLIAYLRAVSEGKDVPRPKAPALPDLKKAPKDSVIASIRRCGDSYFVTNTKGETLPFWEFNLRFKTDTSATGPAPGRPVVVGQGMQGDRAQIVFADPGEISKFVREDCRE